MHRLLLSILASLIVLAPALADAATCTTTGSGTWSAIGAGTATWSCGAGAAGDAYVVSSGFSVSITGNITQDGTAGAGITVQSGGTLVADVTVGGSALTITLGESGLNCQTGSTCSLLGAYRHRGSSTALTTTLPTIDDSFFVGNLIPCSNAGTIDCATTPGIARLSYPSAIYDVAAGLANDTYIDTSIDAIQQNDLVCFYNAGGTTDGASPDDGYCYPVSSATSTTALEFDTRLHTRARIRTLAQQGFLSTTVSATTPVRSGDRDVFVPASFISSGEELVYVGRWIRFADAAGNAEPFAYRIQQVIDGGGGDDRIILLDVRGIAGKARSDSSLSDNIVYPTSRVAWIDYGWRTGDAFFVVAPVRILSATAGSTVLTYTDTPITISGSASLRGVYAAEVGQVKFTGSGFVIAQDIMIREADSSTAGNFNAGGMLTLDTVSGTFSRILMIGGDHSGSTGTSDDGGMTQHGVITTNESAITFNGLYARYLADDAFAPASPNTGWVTINEFRAQSDLIGVATSGGLVDIDFTTNFVLSIRDFECVVCDTSTASTGGTLTGSVASTSMSLSGGLLIAANYLFEGDNNATISDSLLISPFAYTGRFPKSLSRSVIRDSGMVTAASPLFSRANTELRNVLMRNLNATNQNLLAHTSPTSLVYSNVAILDSVQTTAASGAVVAIVTPSSNVTVENVTFHQRLGLTPTGGNFNYGALLLSGTWGSAGQTIKNILVSGFVAAGTSALVSSSAANYTNLANGSNWCTFNNTADFSGITASQVAANGGIRGLPPMIGFIGARGFSTLGGGIAARKPCGASANVGTPTLRKFHGWSQISPETLWSYQTGGAGGFVPRAF